MPTYYYQFEEGGPVFPVSSPTELSDDQVEAAVRQQISADVAKTADKPYSATEGMGFGRRAITNIGAGMANLGRGVTQTLLPKSLEKKIGLTDEYIEDARKVDQSLRERDPYVAAGLQVAGEVLPTIPVAAAAGGAALPQALARLPKWGKAALTGATAGGALGGTMPSTSDESVAMNTAIGTATGGVVPIVGKGALEGGRLLRRALSPSYNARKVTQAAERKLAERAGAGAVPALEAPRTGAGAGIPMSAAEKSGSYDIAALERESAKVRPAEWAEFRAGRNEATQQAVEGALPRRGQVAPFEQYREQITGPLREEAVRKASRWKQVAQPLNITADDIIKESAKGTPNRSLGTHFKQMLGENPNPEQLYQYRKMLVDKLHGGSQDELSAIVKGADRDVMRIVSAIDDRLDEASDGAWNRYMREYEHMSRAVDDARAQRDLSEAVTDVTRPRSGSMPEVTRHTLQKDVGKTTESKKFGSKLLPDTERNLGEIQRDLGQIEEVQRTMKTAGTSGGGSNTAMDLSLRALGSKGARVVPVLKEVLKNLDEAEADQMVRLLQDPQAAAQAIRARLAANQTLSAGEQAALVVLSQVGNRAIAGPRK